MMEQPYHCTKTCLLPQPYACDLIFFSSFSASFDNWQIYSFMYFSFTPAQKLKKVWVEKTKLRSKWKAQKRKEGLDNGWPRRSNTKGDLEDDVRDEEDVDKTGSIEADAPSEDSGSDEESGSGSSRELSLPSKNTSRTGSKAHRREDSHNSGKSKGKQRESSDDNTVSHPSSKDREDKPSLRDLTRLAYPPASLHTYKADPLLVKPYSPIPACRHSRPW